MRGVHCQSCLFLGRSVQIVVICTYFLGNNEECALYKVDGIMRSVHCQSCLCLGRSVQIIVICTYFLGNNVECALYKVNGIMRSVRPVNLSVECIAEV